MRQKDLLDDLVQHVSFGNQAAADATDYIAIWTAPIKCYVTKVEIVVTDTLTGADTNTMHLNLDDNDRTTELANKDFTVAGGNLVQGTELSLYAPAAPGKSLAAGDNLYLEREKIGTGLALAVGIMTVTYRGR